MIELNKKYSTKALAEALNMSYSQIRQKRSTYEKHLSLFYDYTISIKGNAIYYIFKEQYDDYIPYREYSNAKRSKLLQTKIKETIQEDNRQTGSNIARIIIVDNEIEALNLQLSTLTNYTRIELRELVDKGYYLRTDYEWCYLDKEENKYVLMNEKQIEELRSYFKNNSKNLAKEEEVYSLLKEKTITSDKAFEEIGKIRVDSFNKGIQEYYSSHNVWPMKVPVYVRNALIAEND